jgi:predicted Zn-dependent protease
MTKIAAAALAALLTAAPAFAQLGGALGKLNKAKEVADKVADIKVSEADERKIGDEVSLRVRQEFGVYQDKAVTRYVTLVGTVLARESDRPNLKWEFIVLDTDGVNAFAAPGGIVHITRGALGLIKSEAELAGVLGHEVAHVAQKHTAKAIEKNKTIKLGTDVAAGSREWVNALADAAYDNIVEKGFDRGQENDADQVGLRLANRAGYDPSGLATFLTKLNDRNQGVSERNGLFASHPETKDRIDRIGKQIKSDKLAAVATVAPRYTSAITFDAKPITEITAVASGTKGLAAGSSDGGKTAEAEKKDAPKSKTSGLGALSLTKGKQAEGTQVASSAGGRAIGPDRLPTGSGGNPAKVVITVSDADLAAFKKGIA